MLPKLQNVTNEYDQRVIRIYNKSIATQGMSSDISDTQQTIIDVVGWIYFFAWSISFYGQIYTNYKVKNVQGMNFDFVAMNLTGFLFYGIYNTYGYFINDQQTGKVDLNDIFFAYHALFATVLTITQICIYPKKQNRIHWYTVVLLIGMWTFAAIYTTLIVGTKTISPEPALGEISFLGYFKLAISTLKYLPQLYWNYQRKSTAGWSIFNILMDLTGGLFSFGQMGLEAMFGLDVKINIVKLILGIMVVFYDILFVVQHYCLYRQKKPTQISTYSKFVDQTIKSQSLPQINKTAIQNASSNQA